MDLEQIRTLLGWCTVLNTGLLLFWVVFFIFGQSFIHQVHGRMFAISATTMNTIHYCGMGFYKVLIVVFNLIPYIALRMVT